TGSIAHRAELQFNTYDATNVSRQSLVRSEGGDLKLYTYGVVNLTLGADQKVTAHKNLDVAGNTTIGGTLGVTGASTLTGGFTAGAASIIRDGTPTTAQPHPSDSLLGIEDADGSVVQMSLRGTGTKSIAFANANSSADGFLNYTTS